MKKYRAWQMVIGVLILILYCGGRYFLGIELTRRDSLRLLVIVVGLICAVPVALSKKREQCPNCGEAKTSSGDFCPHCGHKLKD